MGQTKREYGKIGFIGTGNMGAALARAVRRQLPQAEILLANRSLAKALALAKELSCQVVENHVAAAECQFLFLGVKPGQMGPLLTGLSPVLKERETPPLLVSMAAGITLEQLDRFSGGMPGVRIMPNTPVAIGRGITLYAWSRNAPPQSREAFLELLAASGSLIEIEEHLMGAAGKVAGCGPAFVDLFIEALADGGVASGLPRELALRLAEEMTAGAAMLALDTKAHPGALKDAVCSPGGSTIQGIRALEKAGFRSAVMEAVIAADK